MMFNIHFYFLSVWKSLFSFSLYDLDFKKPLGIYQLIKIVVIIVLLIGVLF